MKPIEEALVENLHVFQAFVRNRIGDPHLAEDVVQESLVKALSSTKQPSSEEETVTWFYRILRHSMIDLYRRDASRKRTMENFESKLSQVPTVEEEQVLCQCFKRLMPVMPVQYRDLLQRIDLEGQDLGQVATELDLTRNNLTVRLHRARNYLREALMQNCRACAKHGCLDCTCGEPSQQ